MGARTKLFCVDCETSSEYETKTSPKRMEESNDELDEPDTNGENEDITECVEEVNVRRSNSVVSDVSKSNRCYSEPDLSSDTGERYWASYLTSTPAGLPLRQCKDINFTPVGSTRKSMSPITRSTQRMCKAMQV